MKDVVCGMEIEPAPSTESIERDGVKFYFCSRSCKDTFEMDPDFFVAEQAEKFRKDKEEIPMGAVSGARNPGREILRGREW
jgi:YHS domain-containing protein